MTTDKSEHAKTHRMLTVVLIGGMLLGAAYVMNKKLDRIATALEAQHQQEDSNAATD